MSAIEWTEKTWNPIVGCSRISPGCQHCYAERMAKRLAAMGQEKYEGTIDKNGRWSGVLNFGSEETLNIPIYTKKPTTYFVNSMSDLFHESLPFRMVQWVWWVMANAPRHTFQVLTKRADVMQERARELSKTYGLLENVWLGVSVESSDYASRIDYLRDTPAAIRFLSLEPLLSALTNLNLYGIDWVIVGGESGPGARPMNPDWVRDIRDQCQAAGVSFFFKQWGGANKKKAGRVLDGLIWNEMPER